LAPPRPKPQKAQPGTEAQAGRDATVAMHPPKPTRNDKTTINHNRPTAPEPQGQDIETSSLQ
jgi:hypothetical protein